MYVPIWPFTGKSSTAKKSICIVNTGYLWSVLDFIMLANIPVLTFASPLPSFNAHLKLTERIIMKKQTQQVLAP